MMYIVYAFHSPKYAKIYIGYTSNLEQRMHFHNKLWTKGWTIKYRPWKIVHTEEVDSKRKTMKREKQLKSGGRRRFIWSLIITINSSWSGSYPPAGGRGYRAYSETSEGGSVEPKTWLIIRAL